MVKADLRSGPAVPAGSPPRRGRTLNIVIFSGGRGSGGFSKELLRDPRILFLDEPSTGIDREGERLFYDILESLRQSRKMAVMMVSHDISVVYRHASHVICINRRLMCEGSPGEIAANAEVRQVYLGERDHR